jgi:hypothetical protein
MTQLDPNKVGASLGLFLGTWHLLWSLLVAVGWGQPLIDFVLWAHMIHLPYVVGPFELARAAVLILLTTLAGYSLGWLFATFWNIWHQAAK